MKFTEIIEAIRQKLTVPGGRHLYGVMGTYSQLDGFSKKLRQAKTTEGDHFPKPVNVNRGILDAIPDDEFRQLAENEAKRPEPTAAHVVRAFAWPDHHVSRNGRGRLHAAHEPDSRKPFVGDKGIKGKGEGAKFLPNAGQCR